MGSSAGAEWQSPRAGALRRFLDWLKRSVLTDNLALREQMAVLLVAPGVISGGGIWGFA
jgi:hypothetical protein